MIKLIERLFSRVQKLDVVCFLLLFITVLATRIVLLNEAQQVYAQDAYIYISEAQNFAYDGTFEIRTGLPFIFSLGVCIKLLGPFFGELVVSRLFMVIASLVMFFIFFKIGQKMAGRLFGLFACLLAIMEPYCLKYSTVPYLEVFVIATSLLALYFAFSRQNIHKFLTLLFFYVTVLTRPEFYLPLVVPIVLVYLYNNCQKISKQEYKPFLFHFSFVLVVYVLPFVLLSTYVNYWGAFGLIQRIQLFLTPELLLVTINSVFQFYDQLFFNHLISLFVLVIVGFAFLMSCFHVDLNRNGMGIKFLAKSKLNKNFLFSDNHRLTAFCIVLFFVIYLFVITLFAYGYTWAFYVTPTGMSNINVLREAVIVSSSLHDRYLILLRLLVSFPLAFPITILVRKVWGSFVK